MKLRGKAADLIAITRLLARLTAEVGDDETGEVLMLFDYLRCYLYALEVCIRMRERIEKNRQQAATIMKGVHEALAHHESKFDGHARSLQAHRDSLEEQIRRVDGESLRTRRKLDGLVRMSEQADSLKPALDGFKSIVQTELAQVDGILKTMVGDSCLAATVFARAAWLPEDRRQKCMKTLRSQLQANDVAVTADSPFLLGNLLDRMQVRMWTQKGSSSLAREPETINSVSLAWLSPVHTLIVDPDGVAEAALFESMPEGSECDPPEFTYVFLSLLDYLRLWYKSSLIEDILFALCVFVNL
jgi:hypothetical protein